MIQNIKSQQSTPRDVLAKNLDKAINASPLLQYHPALAHIAATTPGDVAHHAQTLTGLHIAHAVARAADQTTYDLQKRHDQTKVVMAGTPGRAMPVPNIKKIPPSTVIGDPGYSNDYALSQEPGNKNSKEPGFSWGGFFHSVTNHLGIHPDSPDYANLPALGKNLWQSQAAVGGTAYSAMGDFDPTRGFQSIEGNLALQGKGFMDELHHSIVDPMNGKSPNWNNDNPYYRTAAATSFRNLNEGLNSLFKTGVTDAKKGGAFVYHHPLQTAAAAYMPAQAFWYSAITNPSGVAHVGNQGAHAAWHVLARSGDSLAHLARATTIAYHQHGINGAINQLLPSIMAALSVYATGGADAPEAVTLLDGTEGITLKGIADSAIKGAGKQQSQTARDVVTYDSVKTKAIEAVKAMHGQDQVLGVTKPTYTAEELNSQMHEYFKMFLEQSDISQEMKTKILSKTPEPLTNEFATQAAKMELQATKGMGSFRAGRDLWSPIKSSLGVVGRPVGKVLNAGTARETAAFGAIPNFAQVYPDIWKQTENANANETFGRSLSQAMLGSKNTILSGSVDVIISLLEPLPMVGRSIAAEKKVADALVMTSEDLNKVWDGNSLKSASYKNALASMVGKSSGWIVENFGQNFAAVAEIVSKEGTSPYAIHNILTEIVDAHSYTSPFRLPQMGLYGQIKQLRSSENAVARFVTRHLVQLPMMFDEAGKMLINRSIELGNIEHAANAGRLFTALGMRPSIREIMVSDLMAHPNDEIYWATTLENAYVQRQLSTIEHIFANRFGIARGIPKLSQQEMETFITTGTLSLNKIEKYQNYLDGMAEAMKAHEDVYYKAEASALDAAKRLFNGIGGPVPEGAMGNTSLGQALGQVIDEEGRQTVSAILGNQRPSFTIPSLHDYQVELRKLIKYAIPTYKSVTESLKRNLPGEIIALDKKIFVYTKIVEGKIAEARSAVDQAQQRKGGYDDTKFMEENGGRTRATEIVEKMTVGLDSVEKSLRTSAWQMKMWDWVKRVSELETSLEETWNKQIEATQKIATRTNEIVKSGKNVKDFREELRQMEYLPTAEEHRLLDEYSKLWPTEHIPNFEKMGVNEMHQTILALAIRSGKVIDKDIFQSSLFDDPKYADNLLDKIKRTMAVNDTLGTREAQARAQETLQELRAEKLHKEDIFRRIQNAPQTIGYWGQTSVNQGLLHFLRFGNGFNKIVNEKIFKPMALFTPGWAIRVSGSEFALNTARVGPRKMIGGFAGASLIERTRKAMTTAEKIAGHLEKRGVTDLVSAEYAMIGNYVRGLVAGMDETILHAIGLENYVEHAAYLTFLHEPWLSESINGSHSLPLDDADLLSLNPSSIKVQERGEVKVKKVVYKKSFRSYELNSSGYYMGWHRSAMAFAGDDLIGHPLAVAYLELVQKGYRGEQLHNAAVSEAEKIIWAMPESTRQTFSRNTLLPQPHNPAYDPNPQRSWAKSAVLSLEGTVMGPTSKGLAEGLPDHMGLLEDIANKTVEQGTEGFFRKYAIDPKTSKVWLPEKMPQQTYGPEFDTGKGGIYSRLLSVGHEKMLRPIMETLSRKPTFVVEFMEARGRMEDQVKAGGLTADQADVLAQTEAARHMIRYIHNPMDKTAFEQQMRTAAPFYFAQNQAWRRTGRLLSDNPGAFIQYIESMLAVSDWASKVTGNNGISLFVMPATALWGIPLTGSLSSLMTVDPLAVGENTSAALPSGPGTTLFEMFAPKWGPTVTIPAHWFLENLNVLGTGKPAAIAKHAMLGPIGENTPMWQSFVPSTILRNIGQEAAFASGFKKYGVDTQLIQAQSEAIRSIIHDDMSKHYKYLREVKGMDKDTASLSLNMWASTRYQPDTPGWEKLLNDSKNKSLVIFAWKSALGWFSPVSAGVGEYDPELKKLVDSYSLPKNQGGRGLPFPDSLNQFYLDHPEATIETISKSQSVYGQHIPETEPVYKALVDHGDLVKTNPRSFFALLPEDLGTKYYQPANTALIAAGLRKRLMPEDFVKQFLVTMGNDLFYNQIKPVYEIMKKTGSHRNAYAFEQNFINKYGNQNNPEWLKSYQSGWSAIQRDRAKAELQKAVDPKTGIPEFRNTETAKHIRYVYDYVLPLLDQNLANAKSGKHHTTYADVKLWWQDGLVQLLKMYPDLKNAINTVFANLG